MQPEPVGSPCLPDLVLDAIATGGLASNESAVHLDGCDSCRDRLRIIRSNNEFLGRLVTGISNSNRANAMVEVVSRGPRAWTLLIPGYEILEEISRGGQGIVFRAVQVSTSRVVALKIPLSGALMDPASTRRFETEIMLIARLRHPFIVTVHDSGITPDGHLYVAMELVSGLKLDDWSRGPGAEESSALRIRRKLDLMARICDAVQYAHQRGIMHRDLKPGNIMVDDEGFPRLLDFGIARTLQREATNTLTGQVIGTPAYASPEQVSGDPDAVDQRTDVYSMGVILYELLTGEYPYPVRGTLPQVVHHIVETQPARPQGDVAAGINEELWTILSKAMAKDRERRYQSAGAVAADLRHYLAGEAIDARRDSTLYVLRKAVQKHKKTVALAAVGLAIVVLALSAAGLVAGMSLAKARLAAERESGERARAAVESQRAASVGALLMRVLPPPQMDHNSPAARHMIEGVDLMQGRLELGLVADRPELEASWQPIMGDVSTRMGSLAWAEIAKRQAMIRNRAAHGEQHWSVAQAAQDLAAVVLARGHPPNAEPYARRALGIRTALFGAQSTEVAESQDLLAQICLAQGRLAEAEHLIHSALSTLREQRTVDQPAIAQCIDTQARLMLKLGRVPDACADAVIALRARLSHRDEDDGEVIQSLSLLADISSLPGSLPELAPVERALGVTDPSGLEARLRSLVLSLQRRPDGLGTVSPLSAALRDVLALKREMLGPDHHSVGHTLAIMAWCLEQQEHNAAEALRCYSEAIPMIERELGPNHIAIANALERLSGCQRTLGDFVGAADSAGRGYAIQIVQPPDAVDRVQSLAGHRYYAYTLVLAARYADAESEYRACLNEAEQAVGSHHTDYGVVLSELGWTLMYLGRLEEAERIAREGLTIILDELGEATGATASAQAHLGVVLARLHKCDEAEHLLLQAWPSYSDVVPASGDYWVLRQEIVAALVAVYEHNENDAAASLWRHRLEE